MPKKPEEIEVILATDCGSTTTKAILIEKQGDTYRLMVRGEAPTTVEAPFEDVTAGVLNAIEEIEELSGRTLIDKNRRIIRPAKGKTGTDIYISTSSAGGGLQMMVAGVVREMSAESAERAALGAGAIVMDAIAINDKRLPHQQIERIRKLRPDMILQSGGIDGGTVSHILEMTEIIHAANPRPRLGISYKLPVIFAGNKDAREKVKETLGDQVDLSIVDNLRPQLERENLLPAREKIHDLFLEHVMAQAPGYKKLMSWTDADIMPTPGAVGNIMKTIADLEKIQVVGVDIGGATTDVFSVFNEELDIDKITATFNRTVSANLGMSYSISNVFSETGLKNVMRWIPFDLDERGLRNQVKNKMIRPTTIPQHIKTLIFEQAIAREALRLAFEHHKTFATKLKGVQKKRDIGEAFDQDLSDTLVNMLELNMIIGSGGVLSHAPRRNQSALMMIDAFQPEGITRLTVDSIFMMPQLGVLASLHQRAALDVFHKDCLIYLGTSVVPSGLSKEGKDIMEYEIEFPDGKVEKGKLKFGDMKLFELPVDEKAKAVLKPNRKFDLGLGKGKTVETELSGGVVGIILDGRGRPLNITEDKNERIRKLKAWFKELKVYPEEAIS
ncbi:MAG: glutamate mutase L [Candidatus Zixiibacteriota bacterium]